MNDMALIIPPSPFLLNQKVFVSLGILYVAASLEAEGHDVEVLDLKGVENWEDRVLELAKTGQRRIGISTTSADFPVSLRILQLIKSVNKNIMVLVGGPHATVSPQTCEPFDSVVIGDGCTGVLQTFKSKEKYVHGRMIRSLDHMPRPARHLIDMDSYHYEIDGRSATNVMSQFGCPFNCIFCCGRNIPEYKTVRFRSPENFVAELDFLNETYGYRAFMIHDDEFNLNKRRVLRTCELLKTRDYLFRGFVRTDLFTEEVAVAMSQAGFVQVDSGVESGSARILDVLKKGTTPEINTIARRVAQKHGIRFKAFITIGNPSESKEDVQMTKQWLLDNKPDAFEIYVITPYPGAPIYEEIEKYDLSFDIDYSRNVASITRRYGEHKCYVHNSHLSSEEIASLREEMDKEVRSELTLVASQDHRNNISQSNPQGE